MQMAVCKFHNYAYITGTSTPHISALSTFRLCSRDQSSHNSRQLLITETANAKKHRGVLGVDAISQVHLLFQPTCSTPRSDLTSTSWIVGRSKLLTSLFGYMRKNSL
jgi:hypothetical protein